MTIPRYMAMMTAIYVLVFAGIFWFIDDAPTGSLLVDTAATLVPSTIIGVGGTHQMMGDPSPDRSPLLIPTIGHSFVILGIGICLATFE